MTAPPLFFGTFTFPDPPRLSPDDFTNESDYQTAETLKCEITNNEFPDFAKAANFTSEEKIMYLYFSKKC